jgi:hypothetical protein
LRVAALKGTPGLPEVLDKEAACRRVFRDAVVP